MKLLGTYIKHLIFPVLIITLLGQFAIASEVKIDDLLLKGELDNNSEYIISAKRAYQNKENEYNMEGVEINYKFQNHEDIKLKCARALMRGENQIILSKNPTLLYKNLVLYGQSFKIDLKNETIKDSGSGRSRIILGKSDIYCNSFNYDHKNEILLLKGRVSGVFDIDSSLF